MVLWAARSPPEWSNSFLHDTLGIFLLVSILLVQLEISWWKFFCLKRAKRAEAVEKGDVESLDKATMLPRFWYVMATWGWLLALVLAGAAGAAIGVYKHRPYHRAAMIAGVVEGLMARDLGTAERAVDAALALDSSNRELAFRKAHILVLRDRCEEALRQFDALEPPLSIFETVMRSCALMGVGRAEEAVALVDSLPASARLRPAVALVRAEYAVKQNRPEVAGSNVAIAARSHLTVNRARSQFSYLAAHEQWASIVKADNPAVPFEDFASALLAIHAALELNEIGQAADIAKRALKTWPNDARFLSAVYLIAASRPGGEWEDRFERLFTENVATLDADRLASCLDYAFLLNRPELAWMAYARLRAIDPTDPALFMAAARFSEVWFMFRRRRLGLVAQSQFEGIDLRPFLPVMRTVRPFQSLWDRVPLADELAQRSPADIRRKYLDRCIAEIQRRDHEGKLGDRMLMLYPTALAMAGRYDEAHAKLEAIEKTRPDRKDVLYQHALFYDREGRWQEMYEALREYRAAGRAPNLTAELLMVKALMNLNFGVGAMEVAERARNVFPDSVHVDDIIANIWSTFGFKEQALFVLARREALANPATVARLLHETGRYREAERVAQALGLSDLRLPGPGRQVFLLPPAEQALERPRTEVLSREVMERERAVCERQAKQSASPFMRDLGRLGADWYRAQGRGAVSDPARWKAAGRDEIERAAALSRLTALLALQRENDRAREAAVQAVEQLPGSAALWRSAIALSEGDRDMVRRARAACPDDPDIWLASLVTRARDEGPGEWALREIQASTNRFSAGTQVRAGDFFLRQGMVEPAALAASSAINRGRGLAPAYVLGLTCALVQRDMKWALACTAKGADLALDPAPFYRIMVNIKAGGQGKEADVISALEYLREHFRGEPGWAERLGEAYFLKGDMRRALSVLAPAIESDITQVGGQSLLLAAEAARLDGKTGQAIGILEAAHKLYPDKISVLNNLIYNLAQEPKGRARALELLPKLLKMGADSPAALDTAAQVYRWNGQLDLASQYMEKALARMDRNDYAAQEILYNAADALFRQGDYEGARQKLEAIRRNPRTSSLVDTKARQLLMDIEKVGTNRK